MYGLKIMDTTQSETDNSRVGELIKFQVKYFDWDCYRFKAQLIKGYIVHENKRHITVLKVKHENGKQVETYRATFLKQDMVDVGIDVSKIELEPIKETA